jgi:hypothetical protein
LVQAKLDDSSTLIALPAEPQLETQRQGEPVFFYFNPLCDACRKVSITLLQAAKECPVMMPPLVMRVLPANEEVSLDAAAALELVKQADPAEYLAAAITFVTVLPSNEDALDQLASELLGSGFRSNPSFTANRDSLRNSLTSYPGSEFSAPLVVYRKRLLRRDVSNTVPFDPLHDTLVLLTTIRFIDGYDRAQGYGTDSNPAIAPSLKGGR